MAGAGVGAYGNMVITGIDAAPRVPVAARRGFWRRLLGA